MPSYFGRAIRTEYGLDALQKNTLQNIDQGPTRHRIVSAHQELSSAASSRRPPPWWCRTLGGSCMTINQLDRLVTGRGQLRLFHARPKQGRDHRNVCSMQIYALSIIINIMTWRLRLPPSHPFGHSLPSSILKFFPQAIRLDDTRSSHLSSPSEACRDELANEKTRQAAAMPGRSASQEVTVCGGLSFPCALPYPNGP